MPTYEYRCRDCGREFEIFQRMSDQPGAPCPDCECRAERLISGGAGFVFKGDGFYITDHRSEDYRRKAREEAGDGAGRKAGGEPGREEAKVPAGKAGHSAGARTGSGKRERAEEKASPVPAGSGERGRRTDTAPAGSGKRRRRTDTAPAGLPSGSGGDVPGGERA
jgi:putative FmdB family regulatory protein